MTEYQRACIVGGSWFFSVNPAERKTNQLLVEKVDLLRGAFEYTKQRYPFPGIGKIMKVMISRGLNNTTDALPYGRYILPSWIFYYGCYADNRQNQESMANLW